MDDAPSEHCEEKVSCEDSVGGRRFCSCVESDLVDSMDVREAGKSGTWSD